MMLANKTIVITGVSSGIGADVARLARFHGAKVIGIDRHEPSMTLDGFVQIDLGNPTAIDAALVALPEKIDALCNIAGVPGTADVELVGRVNYLGLRHLTEALIPRFNKNASIVNVASVLGIEWPQRLEKHKALADTSYFEEGVAWLKKKSRPSRNLLPIFQRSLDCLVYSASFYLVP